MNKCFICGKEYDFNDIKGVPIYFKTTGKRENIRKIRGYSEKRCYELCENCMKAMVFAWGLKDEDVVNSIAPTFYKGK